MAGEKLDNLVDKIGKVYYNSTMENEMQINLNFRHTKGNGKTEMVQHSTSITSGLMEKIDAHKGFMTRQTLVMCIIQTALTGCDNWRTGMIDKDTLERWMLERVYREKNTKSQWLRDVLERFFSDKLRLKKDKSRPRRLPK